MIQMAVHTDFEIIYYGPHPAWVAGMVRDTTNCTGTITVELADEDRIYLGVHYFNVDYYNEVLSRLDGLIEKTGGSYEIVIPDHIMTFNYVDWDEYDYKVKEVKKGC